MTSYQITLTLTLGGITADVVFTGFGDNHLYNDSAFACRIGNGAKAYRASVTAWRLDTMHEATRRQYGGRSRNPIVTDANGVEWAVNLTSTTVRNRQARIIGWADEYADTQAATAHRDYSSLGGVVMTKVTHLDFQAYFNVADELWEDRRSAALTRDTYRFPPITIDDLDPRMVARAERAADQLGLSWPPYLPEAEEYALDHPTWVDGK